MAVDFSLARRFMIDSQIKPNDVTDPDILTALETVPRELFVPKPLRDLAYSEAELETSPGRALWSPRDFAKFVKMCRPKSSDLVLVVGAGEGYAAAVFNELTDTVIGIENDEALVASTTERLAGAGADRVVMVEADLKAGLPAEGPYDIIVINGTVAEVPPALFDQLSEGGRLAAIIGDQRSASARLYVKTGGVTASRTYFDAIPPSLPEFEVEKGFSF